MPWGDGVRVVRQTPAIGVSSDALNTGALSRGDDHATVPGDEPLCRDRSFSKVSSSWHNA